MNILITPVGSAGDNYPFIGLGVEFARRGHRVTVFTNPHFERLVRGSGLEFVAVGSEEDYQRILRDPEIWHPSRGLKTIMKGLGEHGGELLEAVRPHVGPDTAIVAHSLDFGSRALAERDPSLPVVTVHLSPTLVRTEFEMGVGRGTTDLTRLPRWVKRLLWWTADRFLLDPVIGPVTDGIRARVGLAPVRPVMLRTFHSPRLTVGLWPDWFAPRQPDYPPFVKLTGFPLFDGGTTAQPVPPDVSAYLTAGEPPIVFTPGSANVHAHDFFAAAVDAATRLGRRTMLLSRSTEHIPANLPPNVRHFPFAPLSLILSRCAALVHHGGVGTTAAGLAGGIPQLIMPMSHDQPNNAHWVKRLNAGDRLLPKRFTGPAVAEMLSRLLSSAEVKAACLEAATRCAAQDALAETVDLIEAAVQTAQPAAARIIPSAG